MLKINHSQLKSMIMKHYELKIPLMVYGVFGIGKSELIRETAKDIAKEKNKEFIDWNYISDAEKKALIDNTKGKFLLCDERLSQQEPSDLKGLPVFVDGFTDWKVPLLYRVLSEPEADGILFFDEINTASPMMMNSCLQIIHDRCVGNVALSKDIGIFGAGNRGAIDKSATFEEPYPLKDRKSEVELKAPDVDSWLDWGLSNGHLIDSRIISFLHFKPSRILNVDTKSKDKPTTPRGWCQLSKLIKDETDLERIELLAGGRIGVDVSIEFCAFLKLTRKIDVEALIKNPESVKDIKEIDLKYSVLATVSEYYGKHKSTNILKSVIQICANMETEFGVLLSRFVKAVDVEFWRKEVIKIPDFKEWARSNEKYLI